MKKLNMILFMTVFAVVLPVLCGDKKPQEKAAALASVTVQAGQEIAKKPDENKKDDSKEQPASDPAISPEDYDFTSMSNLKFGGMLQ